MTPKTKLILLIILLIASISSAILADLPLFWGLLSTCVLGLFFIKYKRNLPKLILFNTKSVFKTMLLMFLISITLPALMSSGALPTLIYHVSQLMVGHNLLLSAFWVSALMSMFLGSAIGTLTILLPLFSSIALQSGIADPLLIGALISGIYIGDRCSPISSGLHLLSNLTETDYRSNMKVLLISTIVPFLITSVVFWQIGQDNLITSSMIADNARLKSAFDISLWRLFPLVLMLLLIAMKQPIVRVLTLVFFICTAMTLFRSTPVHIYADYLFQGYHVEAFTFIKTSGFKQMINVILVIFFSGVLNSYLEADSLIKPMIEPFISKIRSQRQLVFNAGILSIILSMITCSQAMTSIITGKYLSPYFEHYKIKKEYLVLACSNAGLNVVALIPWNVNGIMISELSGVKTFHYFAYSIFVVLLTFSTLFFYPFVIEKINLKATR